MIAVVVAGYASAPAKPLVDSICPIVEWPVYLVLVFHNDVGTYGFAGFQIAAAGPIGGVVNVARTVILCRLRIGTQWARQNRRCAGANHLAGRDALLDPIDKRSEVNAVSRPRPGGAEVEDRRTAVADARRVEQAIKTLH